VSEDAWVLVLCLACALLLIGSVAALSWGMA
jgi:hypothetical protein